MSREGGDNHFISARERDLKPLLEAGWTELELDAEQGEILEAFLETAWLAGTRSGHAKLLNQAIQQREESSEGEWEPQIQPVRIEQIEAEFKALLETAAQRIDLTVGRTVALWDLLSRAWTAGVHTYESEVMASLIERRSDLVGEAQRWLEESDPDAGD